MTWDSYTGFTLLTGLAAMPMGLMPWLEARERVVGVIAGVAMVAYAIDGASRTSGIFFYHPLIFVLPFILVAYYVYQHRQHSGGRCGLVAMKRCDSGLLRGICGGSSG